MHNKCILLLSLSIISFPILAQPTINQTDITPVIGESSELFATGYIDPGDPGENMTWDLSSLSGPSSMIQIVDPAITPNASEFPEATLAVELDGAYDYIESTPTTYSRVGVFGAGVIFPYENNQIQLVFPITYGTAFTDDFRTTFNSGFDFDRTGTINGIADGYGKLELPFGTITDVLRVTLTEVYEDEFTIGPITETIDYSVTTTLWYKVGTHYPVASLSSVISTAGNVTFGSYLSENDVPTGIDNLADLNLELYPNPATDFATLSTGKPLQEASLFLVDLQGRIHLQKTVSGLNSMHIPLEDLAEGMYLVQIATNKGQKSIPLHVK
ncbi:MAG: hypothetical protein ACI959_002160 [Limisphaerales bacterium]|jgi:hypothetical protein